MDYASIMARVVPNDTVLPDYTVEFVVAKHMYLPETYCIHPEALHISRRYTLQYEILRRHPEDHSWDCSSAAPQVGVGIDYISWCQWCHSARFETCQLRSPAGPARELATLEWARMTST